MAVLLTFMLAFLATGCCGQMYGQQQQFVPASNPFSGPMGFQARPVMEPSLASPPMVMAVQPNPGQMMRVPAPVPAPPRPERGYPLQSRQFFPSVVARPQGVSNVPYFNDRTPQRRLDCPTSCPPPPICFPPCPPPPPPCPPTCPPPCPPEEPDCFCPPGPCTPCCRPPPCPRGCEPCCFPPPPCPPPGCPKMLPEPKPCPQTFPPPALTSIYGFKAEQFRSGAGAVENAWKRLKGAMGTEDDCVPQNDVSTTPEFLLDALEQHDKAAMSSKIKIVA